MNAASVPAIPRAMYAIAAVVFLVGGWQAMAFLAGSPLVPGIADIWAEIARILASGQLAKNMLATLGRVACGFVLAFLTAFVLALGMGRRRGLAAFFEPLLIVGLTVPGLVWAILCIIWFGISVAGSAVAVAVSIAPAISLNLIQGVRAINAELLEVAAMLRLPLAVRMRRLWLPGLLPVVFSGARLALSLAWKVIVLVEMFGLSSGVGFQLNSEFGAQNVAGVLAWTICFAAVMAILEYGVMAPLESHLLRWRRAAAV